MTRVQSALNRAQEQFKPIYKMYAGQAKGLVGNIETKLGFGVVNDPQFEEGLAKSKQSLDRLVFTMAETMKNSRNPLVREKLASFAPNKEDGPDEVQAKFKGIQEFIDDNKQISKNALKGTNFDSKQDDSKASIIYRDASGQIYSDASIKATAAKYNISEEEVIRRKGLQNG